MRSLLAAFGILAATSPLHAAPKVAFPYDASVEADTAYVRSGPGSKYYPTGRLKRGDRVVVHRHDPGGWQMIAPPAGSFSWVLGRHAERTAPDRGTIRSNNVVVRVGSFESDIREFFQRTLSEGDEIQILEEKKLVPETGTGPEELWYRIAPPPGEWRWIAGQALSPPPRDPDRKPAREGVGNASAVRDGGDYLANDAEWAAPVSVVRGGDVIVDRPMLRRKEGASDSAESPAPGHKGLEGQLDELDRLDARFRAILDKAPLDWDFAELEQDYRRLRDEVESSNLRQTIATRLIRIDRSRRMKSFEQELAKIADETVRRDAELLGQQRHQEARLMALQRPRFDGAGIVERSALARAGAPGHVLLAPTGRVLAYLVPAPGVDLNAWVGRPAGVTGSRVPHPDLKADLITVTRLAPVRLAP